MFFETIRCKNGRIYNIKFHNERFNRTRKDIFGITKKIDLRKFIKVPNNDFLRCKIIYGKDIESIEFFPYEIQETRKFKLVFSEEDIDYKYKSIKREFIEKLLEKKGDTDDIIIVKDSQITDTSIANIALFLDDKWITPKSYLLPGITRKILLKKGKIFEEEIDIEKLRKAEKIAIMNAMIGFREIDNFEIIY